MKHEIAKLMIATMVVDSDIDERESRVIKGNIQILGITGIEYDELLSEAKEINGFDDFLDWIQPALDNLIERNNPTQSSLAIASMILVAYADDKIKKVEADFIQSTASILGLPRPTLSSKKWIRDALAREFSSRIRKKINNTDNE